MDIVKSIEKEKYTERTGKLLTSLRFHKSPNQNRNMFSKPETRPKQQHVFRSFVVCLYKTNIYFE